MSVFESVLWGIILIPMIIMALFLLNDKGAFLIAGYNTMSTAEQAKYDEKAMCRSAGMFLLWMTCCVIFLPFAIHSGIIWMPLCAGGIIMVSILVFVIYANTGNRFHKQGIEKIAEIEITEIEKEKQKKREKIALWLAAIGVVVLMPLSVLPVPVLLWLGEREPTVKIIDSGIEISGMYGLKIDFTEIADISLMENRIGVIGLTQRTNGYGTDYTQKGYFQSNRCGSVLLFTRTNSSPTIHIKRKGEADVFLNLSNSKATRTLYGSIKTAFAR
jgi:hypothetical protein